MGHGRQGICPVGLDDVLSYRTLFSVGKEVAANLARCGEVVFLEKGIQAGSGEAGDVTSLGDVSAGQPQQILQILLLVEVGT